MFIGLLSDTHGVFDDELRAFLSPVDEIWHAGDFGGGMATAQEIAGFKPLKGVCGNCDNYSLRYDHPVERHWECEGMRVMMTHIGGSPGHYPEAIVREFRFYKPDIFICGHSHILKVVRDEEFNLIYINPGAAGYQGWQVFRTALRFHIDKGELHDMEVLKLQR